MKNNQIQAKDVYAVVQLASKAQKAISFDRIAFECVQDLIKAWNDKDTHKISEALKYIELNLKGIVKHGKDEEIKSLYLASCDLSRRIECAKNNY